MNMVMTFGVVMGIVGIVLLTLGMRNYFLSKKKYQDLFTPRSEKIQLQRKPHFPRDISQSYHHGHFRERNRLVTTVNPTLWVYNSYPDGVSKVEKDLCTWKREDLKKIFGNMNDLIFEPLKSDDT